MSELLISPQGTVLRNAELADFSYIDGLRKKEGGALGFIPKNAYLGILGRVPADGRERYKYSQLLITEDNGDPTGFCYVSYAGSFASIIQIAVQEDARRWHRALLMSDEVERMAKKYNKHGIKCRVAFDLESNFFWRSIGYMPIKLVVSTWLNQKESKSKRPLWLYQKEFCNGLLGLKELEVTVD